MSLNRPTAEELIDATREHLEERLLPALEGADAFYLRVAIRALGIASRDVSGRTSYDAEVTRVVGRLLAGDVPAGVSAEALEVALADTIADGTIAPRDPALLDALEAITRAKLAIDDPRRLAAAPGSGETGR